MYSVLIRFEIILGCYCWSLIKIGNFVACWLFVSFTERLSILTRVLCGCQLLDSFRIRQCWSVYCAGLFVLGLSLYSWPVFLFIKNCFACIIFHFFIYFLKIFCKGRVVRRFGSWAAPPPFAPMVVDQFWASYINVELFISLELFVSFGSCISFQLIDGFKLFTVLSCISFDLFDSFGLLPSFEF